MVNGQPIFVRDLDKQPVAQITKLRGELGALLTRTVDRLIDERLRTMAPPETTEVPPQSPIMDESTRTGLPTTKML